MKILIVEDDANDALLLEHGLRKAGFTGETPLARDGEEAVQYLEAAAPGAESLPDLIMLDLRMPRMGGLELLKRLKVHPSWSSIPAVVLAGYADMSQIKQAYQWGAKTFFIKPNRAHEFEFEDLMRVIKDYWSRSPKLPQTTETA